MNINKSKQDSYLVFQLEGDLDASSSILLDKEIKLALEDKSHDLLVDCEKLAYISSAGLGVFMSYIKDLETANMKLVLCSLSPKVYKVFEILGLNNLLKIVESKADAEAVLK